MDSSCWRQSLLCSESLLSGRSNHDLQHDWKTGVCVSTTSSLRLQSRTRSAASCKQWNWESIYGTRSSVDGQITSDLSYISQLTFGGIRVPDCVGSGTKEDKSFVCKWKIFKKTKWHFKWHLVQRQNCHGLTHLKVYCRSLLVVSKLQDIGSD